MLYTGVTRSANDVLSEQSRNTEQNGTTMEGLLKMRNLADQLRDCLCSGKLDGFGETLHAGWILKRGWQQESAIRKSMPGMIWRVVMAHRR